MMTPPPVSVTGYPTAVGAEARSNYLRGEITENTAYINNMYAGSASSSIAETTVSVLPVIEFDSTVARQHFAATYSPGFTLYTPSSALNEVDNTAALDYSFRPTPHTAVNATDQFQDSSNPFGLANAQSSGISGSSEPTTPGATPPFAKRLTNSAAAEFTIQPGLNVMLGASGSSTTLHYPNPSQTTGLYDSSSSAGSGFYNCRISNIQYSGATYQYADMLEYPAGETSTTQTQTVMGYYTVYPSSKLSLSVSGGPQRYQTTQPPFPTSSAWGPSVSASTGWQGTRASLAASYSQSVTGGGGLLGAFHSRGANASLHWRMSRAWTAGANGAYSINKSVNPAVSAGTQNGHSVSGTITLGYSMGEHWSVTFDYDRLHESYSGIPAISANPDSNREAVSVAWQFLRPMGK
jgi:hypothetical protein